MHKQVHTHTHTHQSLGTRLLIAALYCVHEKKNTVIILYVAGGEVLAQFPMSECIQVSLSMPWLALALFPGRSHLQLLIACRYCKRSKTEG